MGNDERGWQYNKETGLPELTGLPVYRSEEYRSETSIPKINFVLSLIYKMVKAMSSAAQRICPAGFDNKKVIKE